MAQERSSARVAFVDMARGLAVVLMLQTHVYDAWLRPELRKTEFFRMSQLIGGFPAAFFLFLMGVSAALGSESARSRGRGWKDQLRGGLRRAAWLLVTAFAFRFSLYLASERPDVNAIFRVDILNCLAATLAMLSLLELLDGRQSRMLFAMALACGIAMAAPFVWDGGLLDGVPERVSGYLTGRVPNASFPVFPWAAFAFAGYALGAIIGENRDAALRRIMLWFLGGGIVLIPLSQALDHLKTLGPRYDYWQTSPNFVLIKIAVLLLVTVGCFLFEILTPWVGGRLSHLMGVVTKALIQMGRTSLFIYCVHVDLVYGSRAFPRFWQSCEISQATRYLLALTLAMLLLSYAWTWIKANVRRTILASRIGDGSSG